MAIGRTGDLLLAALVGTGRTGTGASAERTLPDLLDAVGASGYTLSERIEVAATLEGLRGEGLVEAVGAGEDGRRRFTLTDDGTARAERARKHLVERVITVVDDGDRRTTTVGEVAQTSDRSPVEVAAGLTEDDVYYEPAQAVEDRVVGRTAECRRIRSLVETVVSGTDGRAIFLAGPGGIGKTTLAESVVRSARDEPAVAVTTGRCRGTDEPFHPVEDLLEGVGASTSPISETAAPANPTAGTAQVRRTARFHEITATLAEAVDGQALVAFLDDLHLADRPTLAYVSSLLEHVSDHDICLLGTYRPAELPADAPFGPGDGSGPASVTTLHLDPLDRRATREVVEQTLGRRGVPDSFVDAIHCRTDGNPLFVEATVASLLECGDVDPSLGVYPEESTAIDLPGAVTDAIDHRIRALDDDARHVLCWAAHVGESVPLPVLRSVSGLPNHRLCSLIDVLVDAGIFDREETRDAVRFINEVVREALLADVSEAERERRHAAIATAMAETVDAPPATSGGEGSSSRTDDAPADGVERRAAAIATHHERADNVDQAIEWYRRAGDRARSVYAHDAAIDHYHSALSLGTSADRDVPLDVAERLIEVYLTTGQFDRAERYVTFVRERTTDERRLARLAARSANLATVRGNYDAAVEHATDGLAMVDEPSVVRCRLLEQKAKAEVERTDGERARETARRYRTEASRTDSPEHVGRANALLATISQRFGEYDAAREHLEAAISTHEAAENTHALADAYARLASIARTAGDPEEARAYFETALDRYEAVGDSYNAAKVRGNLGLVVMDFAEFETARAHTEDAKEMFEAIRDEVQTARCHLTLALIARCRSEYETASRHCRTGCAVADSDGTLRLRIECRIQRGTIALGVGDYDTAEAELRDAMAMAADGDLPRYVGIGHMYLGEVALARGDVETAADRLGDAEECTRNVGDRRLLARIWVDRAAVALERDDLETARNRVRRGLGAFTDIEARDEAGRARSLLGAIETAAGNPVEARDVLESAVEALAEVSATEDEIEARCRLADAYLAVDDPEAARETVERASELFDEAGKLDPALRESIDRRGDALDAAADGG